MKHKQWIWLLVGLGAMAAALQTRADEPRPLFDGCRWSFPNLKQEWRKRMGWCKDDYCTKPMPCVACNAQGCCDDYRAKPSPCVTCNPKGCCDDYRPKCCPLLLGGFWGPGHRCCPSPPKCTKP